MKYRQSTPTDHWVHSSTIVPIITKESHTNLIPIEAQHFTNMRIKVIPTKHDSINRNPIIERDDEYYPEHVHYLDPIIGTKQMTITQINIATDGSYKLPDNLCSYIIADTSNKIICKGGYCIPSHPLLKTAYEAEVHGVLAALQTMHGIQEDNVDITRIIIHIDNKAVVKQLHNIQDGEILYHYSKQYESYNAIRKVIKRIKSQIYFNWIRSHQLIVTPIQKLNNDVDTLAKQIRTAIPQRTSNHIITSSSITITINKYQIQQNPQTILHTVMTYKDQEKSIQQQHQWYDNQQKRILWEEMQQEENERTNGEYTSIQKIKSGWNAIGSKIQQINKNTVETQCPGCPSMKETNTHFLFCSQWSTTKEWKYFIDLLQKHHTIPPIVWSFNNILKSPAYIATFKQNIIITMKIGNIEDRKGEVREQCNIEIKLRQCITKQLELGDTALHLGYMDRSFHEVQEQYCKDYFPTQNRTRNWLSKIIQALQTLTLIRWQNINEKKNEIITPTKVNIPTSKLREHVLNIIKEARPLLSYDNHLNLMYSYETINMMTKKSIRPIYKKL